MEFPRSIASKLKELARFFPAIVVSGARQSGKTFREEIARSASAWKPGPSWVIGTPEASYSLAEGLTAGALRDLPRVLAAEKE